VFPRYFIGDVTRGLLASGADSLLPIKFGSWFQQSERTLQEIMLITYNIVRRGKASWIQSEYGLSAHTVAGWDMFCRETMLVHSISTRNTHHPKVRRQFSFFLATSFPNFKHVLSVPFNIPAQLPTNHFLLFPCAILTILRLDVWLFFF